MSFEQALVAALMFMVGFCGVLLAMFRVRLNDLQSQCDGLQRISIKQNRKLGMLRGILKTIGGCPVGNCPYHTIIAEVDKLWDEDDKGS